MQLKDSAAITYSAEPPVLTVSLFKNGAMSVLQALADLGIISIKKTEVSLDGDSFESNQKYFKQIPGFFEKLDMASAGPVGSGEIYDEKKFWN